MEIDGRQPLRYSSAQITRTRVPAAPPHKAYLIY